MSRRRCSKSATALAIWETGLYLSTGAVAQRSGSRHRLTAPYEALKTSDGFLVVGVNSQRLWDRLCDALGAPALAGDAAFREPSLRIANRDALQARLEEILASDTTTNWVARISGKGVPCGPINDIAAALADPQLAARDFLVDVGERRFPRAPLTLSQTPVSVTRGPAGIGEHSREVFLESGFDGIAFDRLVESEIIRESNA